MIFYNKDELQSLVIYLQEAEPKEWSRGVFLPYRNGELEKYIYDAIDDEDKNFFENLIDSRGIKAREGDARKYWEILYDVLFCDIIRVPLCLNIKTEEGDHNVAQRIAKWRLSNNI